MQWVSMFETERIELVPPTLALQGQMLQAIQDSQVELGEYLPWVKYALTEPESIANTEQAISNFAKFENELRFAIVDKNRKRLVGAIGLIIRDKDIPFFEIGYWVRSDEAGKGYIAEALTELEKYAFTELKAKRVEIKAAECNHKSRAVAKKAGYEFEAILRNHHLLPSGQVVNTAVYSKTEL